MSGRAIVAVSTELIQDLLHMPKSASLLDAWMSKDGWSIEVLVESPDLPAGEHVRTITPLVIRHEERFEWSWGLTPPDGDPT